MTNRIFILSPHVTPCSPHRPWPGWNISASPSRPRVVRKAACARPQSGKALSRAARPFGSQPHQLAALVLTLGEAHEPSALQHFQIAAERRTIEPEDMRQFADGRLAGQRKPAQHTEHGDLQARRCKRAVIEFGGRVRRLAQRRAEAGILIHTCGYIPACHFGQCRPPRPLPGD